MDYITVILPYLTALSLILNGVFVWAKYRRKEIAALVRQAVAYYKDDTKTEDDLWAVMDKLDAVLDKK